MTINADHHRSGRELRSTESRWWCPPVPIRSPVISPTRPITSRVTASHAYQLDRNVLIGHGSAPFTTLSSRSHVIQSP
jgi:hypothetical protein